MILIILLAVITLMALFFGSVQLRTRGDWTKKSFVILSFVMIGSLLAFRDLSVGADTQNYSRLYSEIAAREVFNNVDFEIGYILLVKFLNILSTSSRILFVFEGLLVMICYSRFTLKYATNIRQAYMIILSYLAFNMFAFQLTGVRQAIAMCICLFAYDCIFQKKLIKYLVIIAFASLFHTSALLLLPAYFVAVAKDGIARIIAIALSLMGLISMETVMYIVSLVSGKYEEYGIEQTDTGYIFLGVMTLILLVVEIFWKKLKECKTMPQMHRVNYISWVIWLWRMVTRVTERAAFFYLPSTMLVVKNIPEAFDKEGDKKSATIVIVGFMAVLFLYRASGIKYSFM